MSKQVFDSEQQLKTLTRLVQTVIVLLFVVITIILYLHFFQTAAKSDKLEQLTIFQRTIADASAPNQSDEIDTHLFAPTANNTFLQRKIINGIEHIKAVFWTNDDTFCKYYDQGVAQEQACTFTPKPSFTAPPENIAMVWLTLVPQVQQFCQSLKVDNPTFRLKQYLGLDPNRSYQRFVEVWVQPQNLFRPCPDPQTNDTRCDLTIDPNQSIEVKGIANYQTFFQTLKQDSYSLTNGAPWTRLGYTYDWARGSRNFGASEYIASPGSSLIIENTYTTAEYCL